MLKKYILFGAAIAFVFSSCDETVLDPVVRVGPPVELSSSASGSTMEFTESNLDDPFATFSWTAADFGFQAAVDYTLEMDVAGNDFSDPVSLGVTSGLSMENVTNERINTFSQNRELPGGETAAVEFRVIANVNPDVENIISNVISINIIPVKVEIVIPVLQVPGNYQGWDPANESTVIYSRKSDGFYDGYLYFGDPATEFKYTQGGTWDTNWGDDEADGTLDPNGANIQASEGAAMYYLTCDLNTMTHSLEKRDWGIIGTATPGGWDSDTDMVWDEARGVLTVTMDMPAGGEYKFRANDDWAVNLGDDNTDGSLDADGANIVVEEDGNYTIDLILTEPVFTYSVTKN
jgi:hypothetical protein